MKFICGQTQGDVLADGSDVAEVERWRQRHNAEAELETARLALARGEAGAAARVAAAEQVLLEDLKGFLDRWACVDHSGSEDEEDDDEEDEGVGNASDASEGDG